MSEEIAKLIKARLKHIGKRQAWLAEQAEVSVNAVSKWTKTGKISREKIPLVAAKLGISVAELMAVAPQAAPMPLEKTWLERLNAEEKDLIEQYRTRSIEGQEFVRNAAKRAEAVPEQSVGSRSN